MPNKDRVLILHGWGGSDAPHWQANLASNIAKDYGTVSFPLLDNCHFPNKNRWLKQLKKILIEFQPNTIVCHSLANTLWFWLCDEIEIKDINRLIMVSPPSLATKEKTIKTFFPCPMPRLLYAKELHLIASSNDPWIDIKEIETIAKFYNITPTIIEDGGHINADSGYGEWKFINELVL